MVSTPTIEPTENSLDMAPRRSSSGGMMSPETDPTGSRTEGATAPEQDGFYMFKKDSQRRMTLSKVLTQDETNICELWKDAINANLRDTYLTMDHLKLLLGIIKDYISDQSKDAIDASIKKLKEDLDFDCNALNHVHHAIYLIQDSINKVLRSHSIKPHWMFALDNLVRDAVGATVSVLYPELEPELIPDTHRNLGSNTHSTINSAKSAKTSEQSFGSSTAAKLQQLNILKNENAKLMLDLIESQRTIENLLKLSIEENHQLLSAMRREKRPTSSQPGQVSSSSSLSPETNASLRNWLMKQQLDQPTIERILWEEFTLEDLLLHSTRADLRALHLKGGIELRLWRAILEARLNCSRAAEDELDDLNVSNDFEDAIDS